MNPLPKHFLKACFLGLIAWSSAFAQADKTYTFATKTKSDDLSSYQIDEEKNTINLLFVRKKAKADIYDSYVFDTDLNLISTSEEELAKEKAKSKFSFWDALEENTVMGNTTVLKDNLLTVENTTMLQMVIKKGYIGMNVNTNPVSGLKQTTVGFVATEKVKPRTEDNRKITMIAFRTDMPQEKFAASFTTGMGRTIGRGGKDLSDASGDVLIIGTLQAQGAAGTPERVPDSFIKFVALRYDAKTLEKTAEQKFEFEYHSEILHHQDANDGSNDLLLIFAPAITVKQYTNPNKRDYIYVRVSRDAAIKELVHFESPFNRLNSVSINIINNETYIIGTGDSQVKDKLFPLIHFKNEDDQLALIKLKDGKKEFTTVTAISDLPNSYKAVPGTDKSKPFAGIGLAFTGFQKLTDGSILLTGQGFRLKDNIKTYSDFYGFLITKDGKVNYNFTIPRTEENERSNNTLATQMVIPTSDENVFLWTMLEYTKKSNAYPKFTRLNTSFGNLTAIEIPGNGKFYVNEDFSAHLFTSKQGMFFFGNDASGKQLWLHKVDF